MVIPNLLLFSLFYVFIISLLFWLMLCFSQIKQFKSSVINIWNIMHIDICFLKFEFLNYDNVKAFKSNFFLWQV
jgi:hypothetical protein